MKNHYLIEFRRANSRNQEKLKALVNHLLMSNYKTKIPMRVEKVIPFLGLRLIDQKNRRNPREKEGWLILKTRILFLKNS